MAFPEGVASYQGFHCIFKRNSEPTCIWQDFLPVIFLDVDWLDYPVIRLQFFDGDSIRWIRM